MFALISLFDLLSNSLKERKLLDKKYMAYCPEMDPTIFYKDVLDNESYFMSINISILMNIQANGHSLLSAI